MEIPREIGQHSNECACMYGEFKGVLVCANESSEVGSMGTSAKLCSG